MTSVPHPVGPFLRARRQAVGPADVGYPTDNRRRVPGLRREEVAVLAGLSVDYYVRLEQGRVGRPSAAVLAALADALLLDAAQRAHLLQLAADTRVEPSEAPALRPGTLALLDALPSAPAYVIGRRTEMLACNPLGAALHGDPMRHPRQHRSCAWLMFQDPATRSLYPDWAQVARDTVGALRRDAGRHPDDLELARLVDGLSQGDPDFRRWWGEHHVHGKGSGTKRFQHPVVGALTLTYESLLLADDPDVLLIVYTAQPGSASAQGLALLGSWAATSEVHETP